MASYPYHMLSASAKRNKITSNAEVRRKRRLSVIEAYGGKCACCGEEDPRFLCFDHINGGGGKDRSRFTSMSSWYSWLANNRPDYIQILCHNCNSAKEFYKECPHKSADVLFVFDSANEVGQRFYKE